MPVTQTSLAHSEDEAVELAKKIGFPVVMKIVSPDILHKSDAGGVKVNIKDEARSAMPLKRILKNAKAYKADANIHGVAVQEMAPWGTEVILGSVNDATFGPTIMFGLGGIFVEVLKDVTFRVAPVSSNRRCACWMKFGVLQSLPVSAVKLPATARRSPSGFARTPIMIVDLGDEIANRMPTRCWYTKKAKASKWSMPVSS